MTSLAVAAAVTASVLGGVALGTGIAGAPVASEATLEPMDPIAADPALAADIQVEGKPWGTRLEWSCTYSGDAPADAEYELVITRTDGSTITVATWTAAGQRAVDLAASTGIARSEITGVDIVRTQIMVAAGEKLPFTQRQISIKGHAIECRVNAEDPFKFTPSPGRVTAWHMPGGPGVRVDSHIYEGYRVPPNYDSMIGKLIVHGADRQQAICRMRVALSELVVDGIRTTLPLHQRIMEDAEFQAGDYTIHWLERFVARRLAAGQAPKAG